jgi:hypothetical protein
MNFDSLNWGSPIGLGIFILCLGLGAWGFFNGVAALSRAKIAETAAAAEARGFPVGIQSPGTGNESGGDSSSA